MTRLEIAVRLIGGWPPPIAEAILEEELKRKVEHETAMRKFGGL